ncbi:hypothetical protein [Isoptericola aurantiacus]|uniref:hypothetical protein n=1 Tax=Isoptericola aurantiacus TaxID=3377839 RepID=UPI00383A4A3A
MTTITATVLTTDEPAPVQVLVSDVPADTDYEVVGSTLDGRTWPLPGGVGTSDGGQVRLIDYRAPVNAVVQYVVTVEQAQITSDPVTVPYSPAGEVSRRYLIQSLDGQVVVPVRSWQDNGLPRTRPLHTGIFEVHGRRRPVVVLSAAGDGSTTATVLLDRDAGDQLDAILAQGGAVCVRTSGDVRDLPPSDIAIITAADDVLWGGDNGTSSSRLWTLTLTWIDDPEPGTVPVVWTWGDVTAILAGQTWADVAALFAGQTWAEFAATDWGQL